MLRKGDSEQPARGLATAAQDEPSAALLQASGMQRRVGDEWLLRNVDLDVRRGDRIAIVGPSGGGKTLLLRALAGLDSLDEGEIRWLGNRIRNFPAFRSHVIYLHQRPALSEGTVEENLRQPFLLASHHEKRFDRVRAVTLLSSLGCEASFLSKQQQNLSGGESLRVAVVRAILLDPQILLLDEPTAALDEDATELVERIVANWLTERPNRRAIVWVTHDLQQAERFGNRCLRMNHGQLTKVT